MKNKEELYENIFKDKYAKLKNTLQDLVSVVDNTQNENSSKIKKLEEEIGELKENERKAVKAPELQFPENNLEIEKLKNKNNELKLELRTKIDLMQLLKSESKNILDDLQSVIKNLTKREE